MTTDNKTLADVQPGGRVRLGDQAFAQGCDELRMRTEGERTAYLEGVAEGRKAALSAQPSPSGHVDAVRALPAEWRGRAGELSGHDAIGLTHQLNWDEQSRAPEDAPELGTFFAIRAGLQAALAARQPVGEPVIWVSPEQLAAHKDRVPGDGGAYLPARLTRDGKFTKPLYATPPQAMDYQAALLAEELSHSETIDQRDRCEEVADELADHIARITGVDIGEHSSANCPWQNAIEAAEEYKPAQAVGLGAVREALQAAEGLATVCASVDGYSREEVAASGRAMRQQFADALAKVDSQAVGHG